MKLAIYCAGSLGLEILSLLQTEGNAYDDILFVDDVTEEQSIAGRQVQTFF